MKHLLLIGVLTTFISASAQSLSKKLTQYTWVGTSGKLKVYMNFEEGWSGASSGATIAWSNLYPECLASSTYSVVGNSISTKWLSNTCGSSGTNNTFTFNEKSATPMISVTINGGEQKYYASLKTKP
jgi:hypothetical protein